MFLNSTAIGNQSHCKWSAKMLVPVVVLWWECRAVPLMPTRSLSSLVSMWAWTFSQDTSGPRWPSWAKTLKPRHPINLPLLQAHHSYVAGRNMRNNCMCCSACLTLCNHFECALCISALSWNLWMHTGTWDPLLKETIFALGNQFLSAYFSSCFKVQIWFLIISSIYLISEEK